MSGQKPTQFVLDGVGRQLMLATMVVGGVRRAPHESNTRTSTSCPHGEAVASLFQAGCRGALQQLREIIMSRRGFKREVFRCD